MAMTTTSHSVPLQERVPLNNTLQRVSDLIILFFLISLLYYRLISVLHIHHGFVWLLSFLCESWFTFIWILCINVKWSPVRYKTYPQNLLKRFDELPAVDMFITTADPKLEPPIITVNTVLSLLAVEYPVDKLACYVSDDACSPATFHSLVQASHFAKLWVPFCKKYGLRVRAPSVYFSSTESSPSPSSSLSSPLFSDFTKEWRHAKDEYEKLCQRIEDACEDDEHGTDHLKTEHELSDFSAIERGNHASIVKSNLIMYGPAMVIPLGLMLSYNVGTLMEYFECGLSVRAWWNNQRMQRIYALTSWLFGFIAGLSKMMGLSETIFEITRKDQNSGEYNNIDPRRFTFDSSPVFVPGTTVAMVNVVGLVAGLVRLMVINNNGGEQEEGGGDGPGIGELVCSLWVLLSLWPFVRGLFAKGCYGIPWVTVLKAALLVLLFLQMFVQ